MHIAVLIEQKRQAYYSGRGNNEEDPAAIAEHTPCRAGVFDVIKVDKKWNCLYTLVKTQALNSPDLRCLVEQYGGYNNTNPKNHKSSVIIGFIFLGIQ
jgi:hypothetical protein